MTGRHEDALGEIEQARKIDPLSLIINKNIGDVYYFARQYDRAIEQYHETLELDADFTPAYKMLAWAYEQEGMYEGAITAATRGHGFSEDEADALRAAFATEGPDGYWRWWLRYLKQESARRHVSPVDLAQAHAHLGETEKALEWLERAYEQRDSDLVDLKMAPSFDGLRADPRFDDLLRRIGLEPTGAADFSGVPGGGNPTTELPIPIRSSEEPE